ncbi:transposase, IS481 family [Bordetella pertussis STO1-CHLA-0006]|nr:transposase, IS481 family [Bordetella pertussis STO1-CHLA-0006]
MNTHKHARLTFLRRLEMVQQLIAHQVCVPEAARAYGVPAPTVRKWLGRFLAQGQAGLADASSRPTVSPRAIAPAKALAIVELRRKRLTQARIAQALGVSASTVSRVLARAGLSHLADLEPAEPVVRYEHQAPGDLLHIDIKKLGRIQRPGHRVTGNRRDTVEGAGWDFVFVAIDDHARVAFTDIHPDERFPSAVQFLKDAVAYYQRLGVTIQRLLTDNGSAFRSRAFAALCHELGIKHRFTRPYRPQTNGKAERFIQSALREWAYAHTYQNSQHRADAMKSWLHHYNWHRPHQGIGRAVEGAGWDFVFVAIDDHARVAFTDIHPDERFPSAVQFLKDAVAYYQRLGVTIQRLLTDNGSAFRSRAFAALCHELGIKHRFTRPYRPQTNGKAERFIQSALREWAYAHTYQNSQHRADAMKSWLHHYNWHRPHQGIGRAVPISRLNLDEYNLLTVHT